MNTKFRPPESYLENTEQTLVLVDYSNLLYRAKCIDDTFDSIEKGYLSVDDIIQTLKEEDDLDIRFTNK